jgi:putative transposase
MARLPRITLPEYPHHVIQRGNNRQAIVLGQADRERLLQTIEDHATAFQVDVHAYVLMDNHFHLLLTPHTDDGLANMMQAVGRSYVRYFNKAHGRTGTLWEGRYKSTVIETERYLLACMAYIDLNPVRAGLCESAADYPWSSHAHYIGARQDRLITPHALYWEMGNTPFARELAYTELVRAGVRPEQQQALTQSTLHGWVLGGAHFVNRLQKNTDRRLQKSHAGRPIAAKNSIKT